LFLLEAWPRHKALGRTLAVLFLVWMAFAAVYLDHHWIVDVLLGIAYATIAYIVVRAVQRA
jgi:membrane-associated phospholipid phosphatase